MRKFLAAFLAVAALAVSGMTNVFATETPVSVNYEFLGERAEAPGFAGGKIVVTPAENTPVEGHYIVYYTDDNGVLAGYDELATAPITGRKVTIPVEDGLMIPIGATGIAFPGRSPCHRGGHRGVPHSRKQAAEELGRSAGILRCLVRHPHELPALRQRSF